MSCVSSGDIFLFVEASADSVVDRRYGARYDHLSDHYGEGF